MSLDVYLYSLQTDHDWFLLHALILTTHNYHIILRHVKLTVHARIIYKRVILANFGLLNSNLYLVSRYHVPVFHYSQNKCLMSEYICRRLREYEAHVPRTTKPILMIFFFRMNKNLYGLASICT